MASIAVASNNTRDGSGSRSGRGSSRSLSRTRTTMSPGFQARTLSPDTRSTPSLRNTSRGRSPATSSSGSSEYNSPKTPEEAPAQLPSVKEDLPEPSSNRADFLKYQKQRLPLPFYPASLRPKDNAVEEARPTIEGFPRVPAEPQVSTIDEQDVNTPDKWIPRDPRLVRLTGKHPLNCEAKLDDLFAAGFLTPSNLFYVRSHGACPKVSEQQGMDWKVEFSGLLDNPVTLSIQDLVDRFEVVTQPITLVCAGNRRKEQNMIQKGLGFSWGAAGVSTALFTGVYLADVLEYLKPQRKAKHVIFEGADFLPKGPYGTSQRLSWASDRERGMMLCWAMNGLALEPDHGYPIRLVVPGQIGGRSVKWLTKIELSAQESQHYLHFWDNKVLPTEVSPDQARNEEHWWYDPKYIINDLNVNSAIACPNHDEVLDCKSLEPSATYDIEGYAYAGGGRRVTRVEVSIDDGATWRLSEINYAEDTYRNLTQQDPVYGRLDLTDKDTSFCWCFWKYTASVEDLKNSSVIMVRGMDAAMNVQQRDMYWNATGMMNNWYFRVAVHKLEDGSLKFEHPTMAGTQPGGWMPRMVEEGLDALKPIFTAQDDKATTVAKKKVTEIKMTKDGVDRKITKAELEAHNTEGEPWFVVNGEVYNGTGFLSQHPGGPESITLVAGEDASEEFNAIHSADAKKQLIPFHIGTLVLDSAANAPAESAEAAIEPIYLNKKKWKSAKLEEILPVSHDSRIFRFSLEAPDQELGLPIGQHVYIRLRRKVKSDESTPVVEGELVQRAYTPVSQSNAKGFIDLLIKIYFPSTDYPTGGKMTGGFHELEVGDRIEIKGPLGGFEYCGNGLTKYRGRERKIRKFGMVCAGSGITPILQVLRGIFQDESDTETEVWILNANKTFEDILCREELHELQEKHNARYRLHHTLTATPEEWQYSKGRMNQEMLKAHMPPPGDDTLLLTCGPDQLIHQTLKPALVALGWDVEDKLIVF